MKVYFKHKKYPNVIIDKDYFNKCDEYGHKRTTFTFHAMNKYRIPFKDDEMITSNSHSYTLLDILNSDDFIILTDNDLTKDELEILFDGDLLDRTSNPNTKALFNKLCDKYFEHHYLTIQDKQIAIS